MASEISPEPDANPLLVPSLATGPAETFHHISGPREPWAPWAAALC